MSTQPQRLRRVQLSVPGSNAKMLGKAAASAADHVFLDLEDSVAPNAKVDARNNIVTALTEHDWGTKVRCVRVNALDTAWCHEDIIHVVEGAGQHLDTIMIPKARSAADVQFYATLLQQLELKCGLTQTIGIEVLIEEVEGLQNVEAIAGASPRVESLIFGVADFSASMGMGISAIDEAKDYAGDLWYYPRFRIVMAARAAVIDAIDTPPPNFRDLDAYRAEARMDRLLGFSGKWAIHPLQIEPALEIFTPDADAVESARKMTAAYERALADGDGAIRIDGKMVDAATIRILQTILRKADLIGM